MNLDAYCLNSGVCGICPDFLGDVDWGINEWYQIGGVDFIVSASSIEPLNLLRCFVSPNRLAHTPSSYGYNKNLYRCENGISGSPKCIAPSYMSLAARKYVEDIRKQVDTFCLFGGGATTHWDMTDSKLWTWFRSRQSPSASLSSYTSWWSSLPGLYRSWIRDNAINAVKSNYPAIVGIWSGLSQHYAVATKYRYR